MLRIGQGIDIHTFCEGDHLMLGGVRIPHSQGIQAHSDGDVLLHALTDALLGALALGDIGHYFPDNDPAFANADSAKLLAQVWQDVTDKGYQLGNADITLLAEAPKLAPHIPVIRQCLANLLYANIDAISVKATTSEKMGFVGRKEGIMATAVVLLQRHD